MNAHDLLMNDLNPPPPSLEQANVSIFNNISGICNKF